MNKKDILTMRNKILEGLKLSAQRLIAIKQKENGQLAFSENGKVIVINAREIDPKSSMEE